MLTQLMVMKQGLHNSWSWHKAYTTHGHDKKLTQLMVMTKSLHNAWSWNKDFTTHGHKTKITQRMVMTQNLHNSWSWNKDYTTHVHDTKLTQRMVMKQRLHGKEKQCVIIHIQTLVLPVVMIELSILKGWQPSTEPNVYKFKKVLTNIKRLTTTSTIRPIPDNRPMVYLKINNGT